MPHVVTQSCCNDASCVYACPVNCIQPTPDDPAFAQAEMLHIDPLTCVDCGACVPACPVGAIKPHTALLPHEQPFALVNADYHRGGRPRPPLAPVTPPLRVARSRRDALRVAIVGSGAAGMYAAEEVLTIPTARVDVFERLAVPYGLARFGVAPDHERTRRISRQFDAIRRSRRLRLRLGTEVGRDVTLTDLLGEYHAVIVASGASADRRLDLPGRDLPGVVSATEFVGWYTGHPDHAHRTFDLRRVRRAVVIGNGNVGLDVARMLTRDPDTLQDTEISRPALEQLRRSGIEEVIVTSRRGPGEAAFTLPEILGLACAPGVELVAEYEDGSASGGGTALGAKLDRALELAARRPAGAHRRVVLRFGLVPAAFRGEARVEGVDFLRAAGPEHVDAGLVLTSIGYAGRPVPGLPFDPETRTVPNVRGRVRAGVYVAGWIKRGPTGFLGTNRLDAQETVRVLVEDFNARRLQGLVSSARR